MLRRDVSTRARSKEPIISHISFDVFHFPFGAIFSHFCAVAAPLQNEVTAQMENEKHQMRYET
jgi:hypothetical protein